MDSRWIITGLVILIFVIFEMCKLRYWRRRFSISPSVPRWERLVRRARRLAFKRRVWATLGHFLQTIKKRGSEG